MSSTIVTAEQMLRRMLDPTDFQEALRQEIEDGGVEGLLAEAAHWLRDAEALAPDFESDVRMIVSHLTRAEAPN